MPEPIIRRGTEADATTLAEVGAALFRQTYADQIPAAEIAAHTRQDFSPARQRAELVDSAVVTLLVEDEGTIVGFAQLRQKPIPTDPPHVADVELWRIYLDREWHGRGVGQRLLGEVGKAAWGALSARGIWLGVWERNPRAIAFYAKHGFEAVGHQPFRVGSEMQRDVVMRATADAFGRGL